MNKKSTAVCILTRVVLCAFAVCLLLAAYGCSGSGEGDTANSVPRPKKYSSEAERLSDLASRIESNVSPVYSVGGSASPTSETDVSTADVVSGSGISNIAGSSDISLVRPVVAGMMAESYEICRLLAGDTSALDAEYGALESELNAGTSLSHLRNILVSMDSRLFATIAADPASAGATLKSILYGYTDENGDFWICVFSNTALPGFEDAQRGYSLTILMDNGRTVSAAADSIYSHSGIQYINEYSVRFRLSDVLAGKASAQDLLSGSNRIIFSIFATDNSFTLSEEHYKWRALDTLQHDPLAERKDLLAIIDEFNQKGE